MPRKRRESRWSEVNLPDGVRVEVGVWPGRWAPCRVYRNPWGDRVMVAWVGGEVKPGAVVMVAHLPGKEAGDAALSLSMELNQAGYTAARVEREPLVPAKAGAT